MLIHPRTKTFPVSCGSKYTELLHTQQSFSLDSILGLDLISKMFCRSFTTVLPAALFVISVAQTYELAGRAEMPLANAMLRRDHGIYGNDGYM